MILNSYCNSAAWVIKPSLMATEDSSEERRQTPYPKTVRMAPHLLPFSAYVELSCHTTVIPK